MLSKKFKWLQKKFYISFDSLIKGFKKSLHIAGCLQH